MPSSRTTARAIANFDMGCVEWVVSCHETSRCLSLHFKSKSLVFRGNAVHFFCGRDSRVRERLDTNSALLAGGPLFTVSWNGMGSPPLLLLFLLQIDGFADGVGSKGGRKSLFPESKSNSFVIHCVARGHPAAKTDGCMDGRIGLVTKNAHRGCFCGPSSKRRESLCGANYAFSFCGRNSDSKFNFNFPHDIRGIKARGPSTISAL